jgi:HK97 family phage portal protein
VALLDRIRPSNRTIDLPATASREVQPTEQRDPRAATANPVWRSSKWGMQTQWNADDALRWAYYANTYVYACIRAIAQDISALSFRAGPDIDDQTQFRPEAPLAKLLGPPPGGPTANLSARRLWAWTVTQYLVTGRWAWEIESARGPNGQVVGLWPLIVGQLKPIPTSGGSAWWAGFEYWVQGKRIDLRPEQVLYDWRPSQYDFREPESALQAARLDISVAVMQDRYDWAFLQNDARPAAVVVHEKFEEEGQKMAWRRQFEDRHQGPENAGRVAWAQAEGGSPKDSLFIQTLGLSQSDAEFIPRYEAKIRAICVALGVPLSRLGDSSKRTFSNADRETINYWRNTVWPILTELQDSINMHLAPRVGREVGWFDTSGVAALREAPRWAPADGQAMVDAGTITVNEHRKELGLPPKPDGDDFEKKPEPVAIAPPPPAALPAADEPPDGGDRVVPLRQVREARGEVADFVSAEKANQRRAKLWHQTNKTVETLESRWERKIQGLFNDQRDSVIARLEGKRGRQQLRAANPEDISHAYDQQYWINKTKELTRDLYEQVMATAGTALAIAYDIDFELDAVYAQDYILMRANMLAGQINDTTYTDIKQAMADGAAEGEGIPKLANRIRTLFDQTYAKRAETVARTEVISAYNGSTVQIIGESDQTMGLEWIATRDKRVRKTHLAMDGKTIGKGEYFELDGAIMSYPGDPNLTATVDSTGSIPNPASFIVNCRCTVAPIVREPAARVVPEELVRQAVLAFAMGRVKLPDALAMLAS